MGTGLYGVIVTVVVLVAIAVFILLFERRRAREIQADLRRQQPGEGEERRD